MTKRPDNTWTWLLYGARTAFVIGLIAVAYLSVASGQWVPLDDVSDKFKHAGAYFALTVLGTLGFPWPKGLMVIGFALLCFGSGLEGVQALVPGRVPDLADIVANTLGVVVGLAIAGFTMVPAFRRAAATSGPPRR